MGGHLVSDAHNDVPVLRARSCDGHGCRSTRFVTLDCTDPGPLAEFWAAILGGEVMFTTATSVGVRTDWTWIAAMAVPDYQPPTWPEPGVPKQIHLDLAVSDRMGR